MTSVRTWIWLVLLALATVWILDVAGVLDAGDTVSRWWPVAIIGLGLVVMLANRWASFGSLVITVLGVLLLADRQGWLEGDIVWPAILVVSGLLLLVSWRRRRTSEQHDGATSSMPGLGWRPADPRRLPGKDRWQPPASPLTRQRSQWTPPRSPVVPTWRTNRDGRAGRSTR